MASHGGIEMEMIRLPYLTKDLRDFFDFPYPPYNGLLKLKPRFCIYPIWKGLPRSYKRSYMINISVEEHRNNCWMIWFVCLN